MRLNLSEATKVNRGASVELAPLYKSSTISAERFSTNRKFATSRVAPRRGLAGLVPDYTNRTLNDLHPAVKKFVKSDKYFSHIYKNIHKANTLFEGVIEAVSCYRIEQGRAL